MKRNRLRRLTLGAAVLVVTGGATAVAALQQSPPREGEIPRQSPARQSFRVYWVGRSFERLRHTDTVRRLDRPSRIEPFVAEYTSFFYGDCKPARADGCPLPLEIQNWPACRRNPSLYREWPGGPPLPREQLSALGAPAAVYEDGGRVEVYTGNTTVVIFGTDAARLQRAARALRPAGSNNRITRLRPPVRGALEGRLRCR